MNEKPARIEPDSRLSASGSCSWNFFSCELLRRRKMMNGDAISATTTKTAITGPNNR